MEGFWSAQSLQVTNDDLVFEAMDCVSTLFSSSALFSSFPTLAYIIIIHVCKTAINHNVVRNMVMINE